MSGFGAGARVDASERGRFGGRPGGLGMRMSGPPAEDSAIFETRLSIVFCATIAKALRKPKPLLGKPAAAVD